VFCRDAFAGAEESAKSTARKRLADNPPSFPNTAARHSAIDRKNSLKAAQALDASSLS